MKNRTELALEECLHLPCLHTYFPKWDLFTCGTQVQRNLDYPSLQSPQCGDVTSRGRGRQRLSRLLCGVRAACLGCFPDSVVGEHLQVLLPVHIWPSSPDWVKKSRIEMDRLEHTLKIEKRLHNSAVPSRIGCGFLPLLVWSGRRKIMCG